jgi:opine dehydrogenase
MHIAVLSAGNSGLGMTAHLCAAGYPVRLWNRSPGRLDPIQQHSALVCSGVFNNQYQPELVSCDLLQVVQGAQLIIVTSPATAHADIALQLLGLNIDIAPVLLSPGRTLGAFCFQQVFDAAKRKVVVAEAQTVIHTCRDLGQGRVHIFSVKPQVDISSVTVGDAEKVFQALPAVLQTHYRIAAHWIITSLGNIGFVLHCAPMLLNTGWVENSRQRFNFYRDGISSQVAQFIEKLDAERCEVALKLGYVVPTIHQWLHSMYGTVPGPLYSMLQQTSAYQFIDAPDSMDHRYIDEDIPCGLVPVESLARRLSVKTPACSSIIDLASLLLKKDYRTLGRQIPEDIGIL